MTDEELRPPTAEEFASWLTPSAALDILKSGGQPVPVAVSALCKRLQKGLVRAVAKRTVETVNGREDRRDAWDVPGEAWMDLNSAAHVWITGDHSFEIRTDRFTTYQGATRQFDCFDVRFEPGGVEAMRTRVPHNAPAPATPPPAESSNRGAPRKAFWEDLWAEIAAQISTGELSASKQADIERAMLEWADANGKSITESTVRLRAQKLRTLIKQKADK